MNVSGRQLDNDLIIDQIGDALAVSNLGASSLVIEVTETALMLDVDSAVHRLQAIKDLGVSIAIDDFGTGYSSLSYLREFPIDCIKIDQSFTTSLATSSRVEGAREDLHPVGSRPRTEDAGRGRRDLRTDGYSSSQRVNEVQGFLFSRPLSPEALERQLLVPMRTPGRSQPPREA